jgi:hypothetical protein
VTSSAASSTNTNAQHDNRPTSDTPRANYGFIQASDRLEGDFTAQDEANLVRLALLVSTALDALAQLHLPEYRAKVADPPA